MKRLFKGEAYRPYRLRYTVCSIQFWGLLSVQIAVWKFPVGCVTSCTK
ncbi:MAG: hypothetical protein LBJ00_10720 [Planctomycetaceae bacterium]|nr:hypothetical protein [Planctomycetaceae bacterium]